MTTTIIGQARVDPSVWQLQPGYEVLLIQALGLRPGPSDAVSEAILGPAEQLAARKMTGRPLTAVPELAAWRAAYQSFGAKPQRTRPSVEALLRRLEEGLPRVDRLTDIYNAVSIAHLLPVGGEDLAAYVGPPMLTRASGGEPFDTVTGGEAVLEHAEPGEIIWQDDAGITCRRWNWRQCTRTRLTATTTHAIFILDWLPADSTTQSPLEAAGRALLEGLITTCPGMHASTRHLTNSPSARADRPTDGRAGQTP